MAFQTDNLPKRSVGGPLACRFVRNVLMYLNNTLDTFCSKIGFLFEPIIRLINSNFICTFSF